MNLVCLGVIFSNDRSLRDGDVFVAALIADEAVMGGRRLEGDVLDWFEMLRFIFTLLFDGRATFGCFSVDTIGIYLWDRSLVEQINLTSLALEVHL